MLDAVLARACVLLVEDEYLLADQIARAFRRAGAEVVGPASTLAQGLALVGSLRRLDVAVLDVNLGGEAVYPLADELARREVPFLFATGYDAPVIDPRYARVPRVEKPHTAADVLHAARGLVAAARRSPGAVARLLR